LVRELLVQQEEQDGSQHNDNHAGWWCDDFHRRVSDAHRIYVVRKAEHCLIYTDRRAELFCKVNEFRPLNLKINRINVRYRIVHAPKGNNNAYVFYAQSHAWSIAHSV
jgi:hypothetical protein